MPLLSVVIPTYNEAANIGPLLRELQDRLRGIDAEFVVVDDDSKDGTARLARQASPDARVVVRKAERGLATAVVRGLREATGTYVVVMDADFQHPPEAVRRLLEKALATGADLVLGSRYAKGGSQGGFAPHRRVISWGAATLSRIALPSVHAHRITDPMTGLFLVRRDRVAPEALRPTGYKVLLEIMARSDLRVVEEVGYTFQDRRGGASKLGSAVILQYLAHVLALGWSHPENRRAARFVAVGLSGVVVNLGLLWLLHGQLGIQDWLAVAVAVEVSILTNFILNDAFTFHDRRVGHPLQRLLHFNAVSLFALAVNLGVYLFLRRGLGFHYLGAEAIAIAVAFLANYLGNLHWTYGDARSRRRLGPWIRALPFALLVSAAGWTYVHDLDHVQEVYFDEEHYLGVARQMTNGIWNDPCWDHDKENGPRPVNWEHPPLAKLIMAWSMDLFDTDNAIFKGCRQPDCPEGQDNCQGRLAYQDWKYRMQRDGNPYAWRLPSAILGTMAVAFTALAARRIFRSDLAGVVAGSLVLLDGLMLTSSRIALLDIYAAGFTCVALWCATYPTKSGLASSAIFLGLGFASKYSVLFAAPAILLVALWAHHRDGRLTRRRFDLALGLFVVLPFLVWFAAHAPWLKIWTEQHSFGWAVGHLVEVTKAALEWDSQGTFGHPYASAPGTWLTLHNPVYYYGPAPPPGVEGVIRIHAIGNPVVWWPSAAAALGGLGWGAWRGLERLRLRNLGNPLPWATLPAITVAALVPTITYLGFVLMDAYSRFQNRDLAGAPPRTMFSYYMALVVPLMTLPLAGLCAMAWRRGGVGGRTAVVALMLMALAALLWYWPILTAELISHERFERIQDSSPWMRRL